jgi:hypothetical protein
MAVGIGTELAQGDRPESGRVRPGLPGLPGRARSGERRAPGQTRRGQTRRAKRAEPGPPG